MFFRVDPLILVRMQVIITHWSKNGKIVQQIQYFMNIFLHFGAILRSEKQLKKTLIPAFVAKRRSAAPHYCTCTIFQILTYCQPL